MSMIRYSVAEYKGRLYVISNSSRAILKSLNQNSPKDYEAVEIKTGIPRQSLYVFVGRLKKDGLVKVKTSKKNGTELFLGDGVKLLKSKRVG